MEDLEKLIDEIFNQPAFKDEDISDQPDEIFITPEIINEAIQKKPYEDFIPTITFCFDKRFYDINYDELQALLGDDSVILNVGIFPATIQVGLLSIEDFEPKVLTQLDEYKKEIQKRIKSPLGQKLGNLVGEPKIHIPDPNEIRSLFSRPSINYNQNPDDIDTEKIHKLQQMVLQRLRTDKDHYDLSYFFAYKKLYDQMEKQIREDFESNPYEIVIIKQTLLPSHYMEEYEKVKQQIPEKDAIECFLYHGSLLNIHKRILEDTNNQQKDAGILGKGIYASDNPFFATIFGNGGEFLKTNEKTQIICCRVIYNKSKLQDLHDISYFGKPIDDIIRNNFGCNHTIIKNSTGFLPISSDETQSCKIFANEFVLPNKFQIIPLCSLTVMKRDHYILWRDPFCDAAENVNLISELSKDLDVDFYAKNNLNDAIKVIQNKIYAPVKLITCAGPNLEGKQLIEQARIITRSNFVCLVFASNRQHLEWILKMENVIFTFEKQDFIDFIKLDMNLAKVLEFISRLERKYECKFRINQNQLLHFPLI